MEISKQISYRSGLDLFCWGFILFLHLVHSPLPFHLVYLSVNVVFVPQVQDCSSSCFCCLRSGGLGYLRGLCKFPDGRDWWWVVLGVALVGRAQ